MTAIAAVIALTSTPAFAQSAETPAPIVETTPSPAPASPDPLAPEATTETSTPEPVASETTAAPAATAPRAARTNRPAARATPTRTTNVTRTRAAAPPTAEAVAPIAPAPVDPLLVPPEMAAPAPIAAPVEPIPEAAPVAIDGMTIEEALPFAGAAGIALLALAGTGIAVRRRRRRREDAIEEAKWQYIEARPDSAFESAPAAAAVIAPAPTFVRTPQADPVPVATAGGGTTAASTLPDGFDVSRFGRHVQAAYAGPTPGNPSASLKRRLTVGHFLDQKEATAADATAPNTPAAQPAPQPAWAARNDGNLMFRRDGKHPALKPAFHK